MDWIGLEYRTEAIGGESREERGERREERGAKDVDLRESKYIAVTIPKQGVQAYATSDDIPKYILLFPP